MPQITRLLGPDPQRPLRLTSCQQRFQIFKLKLCTPMHFSYHQYNLIHVRPFYPPPLDLINLIIGYAVKAQIMMFLLWFITHSSIHTPYRYITLLGSQYSPQHQFGSEYKNDLKPFQFHILCNVIIIHLITNHFLFCVETVFCQ